MIITEPKWKSWIVETTTPLFTPDQCRQIIECGRRQKPQRAQVGMGKRPGGGLDTKKRVTTISTAKHTITHSYNKFYILCFIIHYPKRISRSIKSNN